MYKNDFQNSRIRHKHCFLSTATKSAIYGAFSTAMLLTMSDVFSQEKPRLLVDTLSAATVTKGLPLKEREVTSSANGRKKQIWRLSTPVMGSFEVIGNRQEDADLAGWSCAEFDTNGNSASPTQNKSICRNFFISVLRNVVTSPELIADSLLAESLKLKPQTAVLKISDISIETDGTYYFLRRVSRNSKSLN